ncbi:MAG: hypothetical protein N4A49_09995 [Marinifilaceae bacterium]|jgi:transposase-like protein|nr:hypothetical protein [Marinifilaceae bacterium]
MKNDSFESFVSKVDNLSSLEFRLLKEKIENKIYSKRVSYILETPIEELKCPFCNLSDFIRWGKRNDMQRYRCKACSKTFNSLTKTPLAGLARKGHWLDYSKCLRDGYSIRKAAIECGIHYTTSFRWRHRFLTNAKFIKAKKLGGIVENTFLKLKESFKGSKNKFVVNKKRKDVFVLYGVDRNNNIYDVTNKGFSMGLIDRNFKQVVLPNSLVLTEKQSKFIEFAKRNNLRYSYLINNSDKLTYSGKTDSYKESFKDWINKNLRGVATKYLENYVSWFRSFNEFNSGIKDITFLYRAKSIEKYRYQAQKMLRFL